MTASDTLLVAQAALLGDKGAFGRLVEAYQSPLRRFFYHLTDGDAERSKDLAQETFIKAWLGIGSFHAAASFQTWLYRIAYNIFYDDSRNLKPTGCIDDAPADETVADDRADDDRAIDCLRALAILKGDERTAALLFYLEDKPVATIADIMNCPHGTVKSHLHRGKEKLATYFKNSGYEQR
jgi:RNA polymerase sigma-70 factor (ECF subfamily)